METRQISYMLAIAETGSVTKAAEGLFITRSALDQQLLKLERELGAWLFHSARNRLVPTEAGEIYLRYARRMLGLKEEAYRIIQDLAARAADAILPGADVALRPDLVVAAAPGSGAATHAGGAFRPYQCLFDHGFRQGSVIEGSWMGVRTGRAMRAAGYDHVCGRSGVPFYDRKEDETRKVDTPFGPMEICRRALDAPRTFFGGYVSKR